jgi:hypothetical protein
MILKAKKNDNEDIIGKNRLLETKCREKINGLRVLVTLTSKG